MYPQRRAFLVPVHRTLSSLGAVTGLGVFWVVEMKRDPHAPFESVQEVLIIEDPCSPPQAGSTLRSNKLEGMRSLCIFKLILRHNTKLLKGNTDCGLFFGLEYD
jgi:hypothetical protein